MKMSCQSYTQGLEYNNNRRVSLEQDLFRTHNDLIIYICIMVQLILQSQLTVSSRKAVVNSKVGKQAGSFFTIKMSQ